MWLLPIQAEILILKFVSYFFFLILTDLSATEWPGYYQLCWGICNGFVFVTDDWKRIWSTMTQRKFINIKLTVLEKIHDMFRLMLRWYAGGMNDIVSRGLHLLAQGKSSVI